MSSASFKDLKDVFTIPSVYLLTETFLEKSSLPEVAEWAQVLWGVVYWQGDSEAQRLLLTVTVTT